MGIRYTVEVRHDGLHKYRVISGTSEYVVQQKARAQTDAWDEQWEKKLAAMTRESQKQAAAQAKEQMKTLAADRTQEAQELLRLIDGTLSHTLRIDDTVDWGSLKDHSGFPERKPAPPKPVVRPQEPKEDDPQFRPTLGFLDNLIRSRRERVLAKAKGSFRAAHSQWQTECEQIQNRERRQQAEYQSAIAAWEAEAAEFLRTQAAANALIDDRRRMYEAKDPGAIVDYCDLALSRSTYPDFFPQSYELDYSPGNGILIVDYSLPAPEQVPHVKEVRCVQTRNELVEVAVSEAERNKRYDSLLYQVCLRTIHELFEADAVDALRAVVFNGWVESTDSATGKEVTACVLSIQAGKEAFLEIDLARVDPKACFKSLKGVGSSKLHSLAAIAPLLTINRQDRRFIQGREVVAAIDDTVNLAAMDWEDFEHLVRELFEAEFASGGGEVKVTQASRDGGVDAVAFDPDPIRGGKIIIQAKRYTNVVGVSAVRDLYGTVVNEGAIKGILVTTADYGPDAYEFAKDKPLTLLNGSNLLFLLEKHGHRARIDVKEAKALLQGK